MNYSAGYTYLLNTNGYIIFNELILQWGNVTPTSHRTRINYPISLLNMLFFNIAFSTYIFSSNYNSVAMEDTSTRTLQSCEYINVPNLTPPYFRWLIIGN